MPELDSELQDALEDEQPADAPASDPAKPNRTEARIRSLAEKAKAESDRAAKLEQENFSLRFNQDFESVSKEYPAAPEHKEDIVKAAHEKKLSVKEATVLVLGQLGALTTAPVAARQDATERAMGGSSATIPAPGPKPSGEKSAAELLEDLKEAERQGKIGFQ